ncbi:hypothetical protein AAKU61_003886 [Undibacterium sp. GrIS 1.2]|uniref:hypothetical protein n=1 Tax=Undibacterium sp. GrIS 1.2 TaxID=3143933 RepID=UPI003397EBF7
MNHKFCRLGSLTETAYCDRTQNSVGAGRWRIGYDVYGGQTVMFRLQRIDEEKCIKYWHGYVVYQRDLTPEQWKAGRNGGFPNWPRKPK